MNSIYWLDEYNNNNNNKYEKICKIFMPALKDYLLLQYFALGTFSTKVCTLLNIY